MHQRNPLVSYDQTVDPATIGMRIRPDAVIVAIGDTDITLWDPDHAQALAQAARDAADVLARREQGADDDE